MPCTSFSIARKKDGKGPGPLRSREFLWGLPNLSPADQKKVSIGNRLLMFSMRLLQLCEHVGIPYILENPESSLAWSMPPMQSFLRRFAPFVVGLDYCQFGEPWKKPTQLISNFDISSLSLRCNTFQQRCSRTQRPHVPLTGVDDAGIFMTLRAQPYPWQLTALVSALVAQFLKDKG